MSIVPNILTNQIALLTVLMYIQYINHIVYHLNCLYVRYSPASGRGSESEVTGHHWPFSVHFSHMTDQKLTCSAMMATYMYIVEAQLVVLL